VKAGLWGIGAYRRGAGRHGAGRHVDGARGSVYLRQQAGSMTLVEAAAAGWALGGSTSIGTVEDAKKPRGLAVSEGAPSGFTATEVAPTGLPYRNRTAINPRSVILAQGPWAELRTAIKPPSARL